MAHSSKAIGRCRRQSGAKKDSLPCSGITPPKLPCAETPIPEVKVALAVTQRVQIATGRLKIELDAVELQKHIGAKLDCAPEDLTIQVPFIERRRGVEMKMIISDGTPEVDQ